MVSPQPAATGVRLAEVVGSLSLTTDLAMGQPLEQGMRRALLAVWLGEELGLSDEQLSTVYYVAQLGTVGCTLELTALASFVQDEIAVAEQFPFVDPAQPVEMAGLFLRNAGAGEPLPRRLRKIVAAARDGSGQVQMICRDVATRVGDMIDLGPAVRQALGHCLERWDGKGRPRGLKGEEVHLAARIFAVAHDAEIFNRVGGMDAVLTVVRKRSGTVYDPRLAERFQQLARTLLPRLDGEGTWDGVLSAEPTPPRWLTQNKLDEMMEAIAGFVDSRSAYTFGHSAGVASLAETAARGLGLGESEAAEIRRAGLLHDLGRAGVPIGIWDKPDPLTEWEWARMQRHPSLTELVLARSAALGHLGTLAGLHHERLDGSGYRRLSGPFLSTGGMILAAADLYQTKTEPRPHREALTPDAAADEVQRQARAGLLDPEVVSALLDATGHRARPRKHELPAGLTEREGEVLRLLVNGLSNRQMAERLYVSPKTVGNHIEHIYDKIGVSTRVGATLFVLQHDLG